MCPSWPSQPNDDAVAAGAETLSQHLLGVLMGIRVLARVRPERALREGVAAPAMALLSVEPAAVGVRAE
jgi:hypothetical protein